MTKGHVDTSYNYTAIGDLYVEENILYRARSW